jgi:anaerobic ribonucleoside-triphosphate reductase activating protein
VSTSQKTLRVHSFLPTTCSNGPGLRAALWLQGCSLACSECFNPGTHDFNSGERVSVKDMIARIESQRDIEGVTLSGGEPLQQADGVLCLLEEIRLRRRLSSIVFTGFEVEEIEHRGLLERLSNCTDVLIAGRYDSNKRVATGLLGSANKRFHFFSDRYTKSDFEKVPVAELIITATGEFIATGIDPVRLNHER